MNFDFLLKNWKTTCAGIALLACAAVFVSGRMTTEQFLAIVSVLASGGFLLSKDA